VPLDGTPGGRERLRRSQRARGGPRPSSFLPVSRRTPEVIRSAANPVFQRVRAVRAGKERDHVLLEGARLVEDARLAGLRLALVLVDEARAEALQGLLDAAEDARIVDAELLQRVSGLETAPRVLALASTACSSVSSARALCVHTRSMGTATRSKRRAVTSSRSSVAPRALSATPSRGTSFQQLRWRGPRARRARLLRAQCPLSRHGELARLCASDDVDRFSQYLGPGRLQAHLS